MKEDSIVSNDLCTGCSTCVNSCPKHAIRMIENEEGFSFPYIDKKKCVNCGLCEKICPVLNAKKNKSIDMCYVGYAKDYSYKENSSSGGIFPIIAKKILDAKGVVIGAAFDENNNLNHISIVNDKDLSKLKGSKYLQSNLGSIFSYIKDNIKDKKILFVGTPCQVAGLKSYLKKDYNNLYCIDLVCHGVPSPKLFKKYVNELENKYNDKLLNYNFRDKCTGWDTYSNTMIFKNNNHSELQKENKYMKIFLSNIALRKSCYNCKFKLGNKYSDITLGDFWGVSNYYPKMYNKDGVSAIIINTERGKKMFDTIKSELIYSECKLIEIIDGNPSITTSPPKPHGRDDFFAELDFCSIDDLEKKYVVKEKLYKRVVNKIKRVIKRKLSK